MPEFSWETDIYTPPVLEGAALFAVQRQRCVKLPCPRDPQFYAPLALNGKKGSTSQHWKYVKISLPENLAQKLGERQGIAQKGIRAIDPCIDMVFGGHFCNFLEIFPSFGGRAREASFIIFPYFRDFPFLKEKQSVRGGGSVQSPLTNNS